MRVEAKVLLVISGFFGVVAVVFWATGLNNVYRTITGGGTIMLVGSCLLGLLPGGYYYWWSHQMDPRAEDDPEGTLEQGAGAIGAFPASSIWPFVLGMAAFMVALSLVFGIWTAIFGFSLAFSVVIGVILESRRGGLV